MSCSAELSLKNFNITSGSVYKLRCFRSAHMNDYISKKMKEFSLNARVHKLIRDIDGRRQLLWFQFASKKKIRKKIVEKKGKKKKKKKEKKKQQLKFVAFTLTAVFLTANVKAMNLSGTWILCYTRR